MLEDVVEVGQGVALEGVAVGEEEVVAVVVVVEVVAAAVKQRQVAAKARCTVILYRKLDTLQDRYHSI